MKANFVRLLCLAILVFNIPTFLYGQIGVGTINPDPSSILDVSSTTQGLLMPRMADSQMTAIATPATGLVIFNTDNNGFYFYNGTQWVPMGSAQNKNVSTVSTTTTLGNADDLILVNNSAVMDIDLPTAVNNTGKTYLIKKISDNAIRVRIDPDSAETVDGADSLELFIKNDAVTITSDGANWQVVSDDLRAHTARMKRVTAQSIASSTHVQVDFDVEMYDNADLADINTNQITIRRSGQYQINAYWLTDPVMNAGEEARIFIRTSSGVYHGATLNNSAGASKYITAQIALTVDLKVGDQVVMEVVQYKATPINSWIDPNFSSNMSVAEIR